jgi:hypothetical protein
MPGEVFPAFIRATFDDSAGGFPAFERAAEQTASRVRQRFDQNFNDIQASLSRALAMPRNAGGSLDLGVGEQQAAAKAAEARAIAAREVAQAMRAAAQAEGDYSQRARLALAAAEALEVEERQNAAAARAHADALEQVQAQLNKTASATDLMVASAGRGTNAFGAVTNSARSARFATLQVGQQMQDAVIQWQAGTNALVILTQQGSQAAFALSGMGGKVGAVASLLAGPWGTAVLLGTTVLGMFIASLNTTSDAAKAAEQASEDLGKKVGDIGNFFDLTTGKIDKTNAALREYAALTRFQENKEARKQQDKARKEGNAALRESLRREAYTLGGNPSGIGSAVQFRDPNSDLGRVFRQGRDLRDPKIDEELRLIAQSKSSNAKRAEAIAKARATFFSQQQEIDRRDAEYRSLVSGRLESSLFKKTDRSGGSGTAALNAQAKLAAADEPMERAQARLALTKAENAELLRNGTISREIYRERVQAAEEEVQAVQRVEAQGRSLKKAAREAALLADFGERAAEKIARIGEQFDNAPRDIDQAARATRQLDALIKDLGERKPPGFEQLIADAEKAKGIIPEALGRPFREMLEDQQRQLAVQEMLNGGREDEAAQLQLKHQLMEMMNVSSEEELANALALRGIRGEEYLQLMRNAALLRERARLADIERQKQQMYLDALSAVQSSIRETIAGVRTEGFKSITNFVNGFGKTYDRLIADYVTEKVFGSTFRALQDKIEGRTPVVEAAERLADNVDDAGASARRFADAIDDAADRINAAKGRLAANDNGISAGLPAATGAEGDGGDIVVNGRRVNASQAFRSDPTQFMANLVADAVGAALRGAGINLSAETISDIKGALKDAFEGAAIGQMAGGLVLGSRGDRTGEAIGGIIGKIGGEEIGKAVGGLLGKFGGPIGSALGGVLGGLVGGMFRSPKYGTAILSSADQAAQLSGSSSATSGAVGGLAGEVQSGLKRIADAFGGALGSFDLAIGMFEGKYRVRPTTSGWDGRGPLDYNGKSGNGLIDFGQDQEAAIRFAILNALQDGAIQGIREGTRRLLQSGQDLDSAIQKALSFEQVFRDLREREDPLGAALEGLDRKFENLRKIFADAGASAQELADLERLYGYERADAMKQAGEKMTAALRGLVDDLTIGDSGRSLRDRLAAARAKYDPLAADLRAGKQVDYDAYADASRAVLDIVRQMEGSGTAYFQMLDQITGEASGALAAQQALIDRATGNNDNSAPVVDAVDRQTQAIVDALAGDVGSRLEAVNDNLGTLIESMNSRAGGFLLPASERLNF